MIPPVCRAWAPWALDPCLRQSFRHNRLSVISGPTVSPRRHWLGLICWVREQNINGERAQKLGLQLSHQCLGWLIEIWGNLNAYRDLGV